MSSRCLYQILGKKEHTKECVFFNIFSSNTLAFSISIKKVENFHKKISCLRSTPLKKLFSLAKVASLNYCGTCYDLMFNH